MITAFSPLFSIVVVFISESVFRPYAIAQALGLQRVCGGQVVNDFSPVINYAFVE